mmetsp:Transcript_6764/g.9468  ORF Transcript_6764/g.9468 Transcript_6764/m.9468 type:complete len:304 (+) Transcript_6764:33-944(+)
MAGKERNAGFTLRLVLIHIGIGILLKFMLGSDDLVWLAPFMAKARNVREKISVGTKYVMSVLFLTLLACAMAVTIHYGARSSGNGSDDSDKADEVIATIAAALLIGYAMHMAHEEGYFDSVEKIVVAKPVGEKEGLTTEGEDALTPVSGENKNYGSVETGGNDDDGDEEELGPIKTAIRDGLLALNDAADVVCPCCAASEQEKEASDSTPDKKADNSVIIVAFLGSLDDFMVYFTLALSNQISWYALAIGVSLGAVLIAIIVGTLLQSSETLAALVETIPVPLILCGLAVFILVTTWTGFDGL